MSRTAKLEVNGEIREYRAGALPRTIRDLVESLGLEPARVVAELNGALVPRAELGERPLVDGDSIELVRLVGGG